MKAPTKKYQVWVRNGGDSYTMYEYDSIAEAILDHRTTPDWYLTTAVTFQVTDVTPPGQSHQE